MSLQSNTFVSLLIERRRMIPPMPSPARSLPSQTPASSLQLAEFPLISSAQTEHLHSQFIPKFSNLLYFFVYTAVCLFAPLCSPRLLSGFYCELLEVRHGVCLVCFAWLHMCTLCLTVMVPGMTGCSINRLRELIKAGGRRLRLSS